MLNKKDINSIVDRIRRTVNPSKIIIFGSHAKGTASSESDLDLVIIKDKIHNKRKELLDIKKRDYFSELFPRYLALF